MLAIRGYTQTGKLKQMTKLQKALRFSLSLRKMTMNFKVILFYFCYTFSFLKHFKTFSMSLGLTSGLCTQYKFNECEVNPKEVAGNLFSL
jgi:hypothetical protein